MIQIGKLFLVGSLCPHKGIVKRQESVRAVCCKLAELIQRDRDLVAAIVERSVAVDDVGDTALASQLNNVKRQIAQRQAKFTDLADLVGQGSDEERSALKALIRATQAELASLTAEKVRLERLITSQQRLAPEVARKILEDLHDLLVSAAEGELGEPAVYRALGIVKALTGSQIEVHFETRPGRKQTVVWANFELQLLDALSHEAGIATDAQLPATPVEVWLRSPPKLDQLTERVHQLIDIERRSFRDAAKVLQAEGHQVNSGNVWTIYRRYYEMRGLPVPDRPYNNGHPRQSE